MSFSSFRIENFRSFVDASFDFDRRSVVIGSNGTGKSTLIEAVRLLSVGKSFRTHKLEELINFEQTFFRIQAEMAEKNKVELFYGQPFADYPDKERRLSMDGKEISWLEFFGSIPTVVFSPEDMDIISGSPQTRRRYIDGILWQVDGQFRQLSLELTKILQERSRLLFLIKINRAGLAELKPWNELLVNTSKKIRSRRQDFVNFLNNELIKPVYREKEDIQISANYQYDSREIEEFERDEVRLAQNMWGPHRDELEILLNDRLARKYASRGQIRTVVMIMKIIESAFLFENIKREPVILLDDLFSELDQKNIVFFIDRLNPNYQIIATAVEKSPAIKDWQKIEI